MPPWVPSHHHDVLSQRKLQLSGQQLLLGCVNITSWTPPLGAQVCKGLAQFHELQPGSIHRNVKVSR